MRISELSDRSGVALATVKYYLREGLLHQGEQVAATRAVYDDSHLRRLRLIRALLEVGRLPVAAIKQVIDAVEDESLPVHQMLGTAQYALGPAVEPEPSDDWQAARAETDRLIDEQGWTIAPDAPTRNELAQTLLTLRRLGMSTDLSRYAETAGGLAAAELDALPLDGSRESAVEAVVLGTVLYGRAFDALRRLAHESESARRLAGKDQTPPAG
ncbi:MerR family transcriptional regulator [Nonomuraea muscovyensis]|uniref:DNA-binding transcriptional MerR regulator n=1 Tax=Nonomuraea muscovyensis TaxID=1124761 RepID=A0A7X0BXF5_9ACTN|nr:MerR family transcriptional regulator [Nonomuraea muscovyensis]MBB6344739.1 DNA-binding transcriptional MerR regulator [Nonomuraea muscovyensis]MDF2711744.1 MerR family transcriptional regulator [Nonomuraea muscovyensis]